MEFNTSASVISYIAKIEENSAILYEDLALRFDSLKEQFQLFAKENRRNEKNIRRAYYNIVSDALETNFCFKGLTDDVSLPELTSDITAAEMILNGIKMEQEFAAFYEKAAKLSMNLLADLTRAMERAAKMRKKRIEKYNALLEK